jgi:hypothetical protein
VREERKGKEERKEGREGKGTEGKGKKCVSFCFPKGIILSAIVSTNPQKPPFLLILDAKSFTELARASIAVDMHLDLHGLFIPNADWDTRNQDSDHHAVPQA